MTASHAVNGTFHSVFVGKNPFHTTNHFLSSGCKQA